VAGHPLPTPNAGAGTAAIAHMDVGCFRIRTNIAKLKKRICIGGLGRRATARMTPGLGTGCCEIQGSAVLIICHI
jgi:hypothetical protein